MLNGTVVTLLGLLVVIPVGLGIATLIYESKLNDDAKMSDDCHECCGCMCCADHDECGCCGKPLSECDCDCSCHKH